MHNHDGNPISSTPSRWQGMETYRSVSGTPAQSDWRLLQTARGRVQPAFWGTSSPAPASAHHRKADRFQNDTSKKDTMKNIASFLRDHQYQPPLTPKDLGAPTKGMFLSIFQFLFCLIDPNMQISPANAEDEIPRILKVIGYPVPMSRSTLKAPTAPTSWPQILNAMGWICDLMTYEEEILGDIRTGEQCPDIAFPQALNEQSMEKEFLDCLSTSYREYIYGVSGVEEASSVLDMRADMQLQQVEKRYEETTSIHRSLCERKKVAQTQIEQTNAVTETNRSLEKDLNDVMDTVGNIEREIEQQKSLNEMLTRQHDEWQKQLRLLHSECSRIENIVEKQEVNRDEVNRLMSESSSLRKQIKDLKEDRLPVDKENSALEEQERSLLEDMRKRLRNLSQSHKAILERSQETKSSATEKALRSLRMLDLNTKAVDDNIKLEGTEGTRWKSLLRPLLGVHWKEQKEYHNRILTCEKHLHEKLQQDVSAMTNENEAIGVEIASLGKDIRTFEDRAVEVESMIRNLRISRERNSRQFRQKQKIVEEDTQNLQTNILTEFESVASAKLTLQSEWTKEREYQKAVLEKANKELYGFVDDLSEFLQWCQQWSEGLLQGLQTEVMTTLQQTVENLRVVSLNNNKN